MELKNYQKRVQQDLLRYLALLNSTNGDYSRSYTNLWEEKGFPVGQEGMQAYIDRVPGVPHVCFKIPTGGGKTFQGCCALKPIFDALPPTKMQAVVWLVPSESILTQTLGALQNPEHPYRQKLNLLFNNKVEVYSKEELLRGQNFNIVAVREHLSLMVLSYDSFKGGTKNDLKSKQENSNLAPMAQALGTPSVPIKDTDETALLQVINRLNPVVIVDESHHATSSLSVEMLKDFNPSFILELTATPKQQSNIISYVDAYLLKQENMVKLPVIVQNRTSVAEVVSQAIDMRNQLEQQAEKQEANGGKYIRPIVLFQAQPQKESKSENFTKLKNKLLDYGIPTEQIAIKTASVNELKDVHLMERDCPIRYIITVNALKEGWDCPFAYILASTANKTSLIDVEQIVGRILRQPHAEQQAEPCLNMSYVLTCSSDFSATLSNIVKGLNAAGFTRKDYRISEDSAAYPADGQGTGEPLILQTATPEAEGEGGDERTPSTNRPPEGMEDILSSAPVAETQTREAADKMLDEAVRQNKQYEEAIKNMGSDNTSEHIPTELLGKKKVFRMCPEYADEAKTLRLPQFFRKTKRSLFSDFEEANMVLLTKESLLNDFSLKGQPTTIVWQDSENIRRIDVEARDGGRARVMRATANDQKYLAELLNSLSHEARVKTCKGVIHSRIDKLDGIDSDELVRYIDRIVDEMDESRLDELIKFPHYFAETILNYIKDLQNEHARKRFRALLDQGNIVCRPSYSFPVAISPGRFTNEFCGSLYEAEEAGNTLETKLLHELQNVDCVKWWHRNISLRGFNINAYRNHWPDFIVCTHSGKIILIETKGEQLGNAESEEKLEIGRKWADKAGEQYAYFMVYEHHAPTAEAYSLDDFISLLKGM